jgi:hypothetical protein
VSDGTEEAKQYQWRLCSRTMLIVLVLSIGCIVAQYRDIGKGLLLGTLFSILNFLLMGKFLLRTIGPSRGKTSLAALGSIVIRYGALAIPLVVGIQSDTIHFGAVVVGIFSVQIMILLEHVVFRPHAGMK